MGVVARMTIPRRRMEGLYSYTLCQFERTGWKVFNPIRYVSLRGLDRWMVLLSLSYEVRKRKVKLMGKNTIA